MSKRVVEMRKAIREGLLPAAMRHGALTLGVVPLEEMTDAERATYADVSVKDRTAVMDIVLAYSLPKPKQAVGLKHSGPEGQPLAISIDIGASKP